MMFLLELAHYILGVIVGCLAVSKELIAVEEVA